MWIYEPEPEALAHPKKCKCGAEIVFCKTKAGRMAPLEAGFEIRGRMKMSYFELVDGEQKTISLELCEVDNGANHFSTCKFAHSFRRRK